LIVWGVFLRQRAQVWRRCKRASGMYKNLLSVGGITLVSRATGFLRDVMLAQVVGAGMLADAFVVAFRLPNHFRAIFGEGAFNAAYVPCYAQIYQVDGPEESQRFASRIFTLLLISQLLLLAAALLFMPLFVDLLAPGFRQEPAKFDAAVLMTRITFPYLLFITLVTLQSATLNAHGKFAAAAFAPVLLNLAMLASLALAAFFPNAGIAAACGVTISGFLQLVLTFVAARRIGVEEGIRFDVWTADVRRFFVVLGPAVIGSAGIQIALFADTIIGSLLPTGGPSSIYYADRIYQLPLGVIGIAAGTVLLPEMSRRLAIGERAAAFHAQNRTMALSLALTAPFFVAFIMIPDVIMHGVFLRGAFSEKAAEAAAQVLTAYGFGLVAIVLVRAVVPSFQAIGDTRTPMWISIIAVAVNVLFKIALFKPMGAPGLAAATAIGAWINLILLFVIAVRRGLIEPDEIFSKTAAAVSIASFALSVFALFGEWPAFEFAIKVNAFPYETQLVTLGIGGAIIYALVLGAGLVISGVGVRPLLRRRMK
jgi:putative peptidoglycan lipid II flippase